MGAGNRRQVSSQVGDIGGRFAAVPSRLAPVDFGFFRHVFAFVSALNGA